MDPRKQKTLARCFLNNTIDIECEGNQHAKNPKYKVRDELIASPAPLRRGRKQAAPTEVSY